MVHIVLDEAELMVLCFRLHTDGRGGVEDWRA